MSRLIFASSLDQRICLVSYQISSSKLNLIGRVLHLYSCTAFDNLVMHMHDLLCLLHVYDTCL